MFFDILQVTKVFRFLLLHCRKEVIINGAAKEIGRAAVVAVTKARGMEVAGAIDSYLVGDDIGTVDSYVILLTILIVSLNYFLFLGSLIIYFS